MSTQPNSTIMSRLLLATLSIYVVSACPGTMAAPLQPVRAVQSAPPAQSARAVISSDVAHLNARLTANYGKLGGEYQAIQSQTAGVQSAANADAKAQNGRLTPTQVAAFTKELAQIGQIITNAQQLGAPSGNWMSSHPAAAKVLNSAEAINAELSKDYGSLRGNYTSLELQDDSIRAAAKNLAVEQNGLSAAQVTKFDSALSNLQSTINQDFQ